MRDSENLGRCARCGRIKFDGGEGSAPFPSALLYYGRRPDEFHAAFADAGWLVSQRLLPMGGEA